MSNSGSVDELDGVGDGIWYIWYMVYDIWYLWYMVYRVRVILKSFVALRALDAGRQQHITSRWGCCSMQNRI